MAESIQNFIRRVERKTGLPLNRIPNGVEDNMMDGPIIVRSPHGVLVYVDFDYQTLCDCKDCTLTQDCIDGPYEHCEHCGGGADIFQRCLLIRYSDQLPAADADADGTFPDEE